MPYRIEYLEDLGGIITTYWGVVSNDDLNKSGYEKYSNLEKLGSYRYALIFKSRSEADKYIAEEMNRDAER